MALLRSVFHYFLIFKHYTGRKIYLLILLPAIGSVLEGIGIGLFLPILGANEETSGPLGKALAGVLSIFGLSFTINSALGLLCCIFVVKALFEYWKSSTEIKLTNRVARSLRLLWLDGVSRLKYEHFLQTNVGKLTSIVSIEMPKLQSGMQTYNVLLANLFTVIGLMAVSIWVNWQFTLLGLTLGVVISRLQRAFGSRAKALSHESSKLTAEFQSLLIQSLQSFKYLISTGNLDQLKARLEHFDRRSTEVATRISVLIPLHQSISQPIMVLAVSGIIYWQNSLLGHPIPIILTSLLLFYRVTNYLLSLQGLWYKFCTSTGSIEAVMSSLKWLKENETPTTSKKSPVFKQAITLKKVGFSYPTRNVLQSIDVEIPKNKMIAVVGESGAGKTTLVDLLTGLLRPSEGELNVDGERLDQFSLQEWRKSVGYVTQEPALFNDSILNNITLWDDSVPLESAIDRAWKALELANADRFVRAMPDGIHTILGDRGATVSGGQRQRLSIARELYRQPQLLILDEATSSLDSESEIQIQKAIEALRGHLTVVVIAHRLSTVRNADIVYVVSGGQIVEHGEFNELVTRPDSVFRQMAAFQKLIT